FDVDLALAGGGPERLGDRDRLAGFDSAVLAVHLDAAGVAAEDDPAVPGAGGQLVEVGLGQQHPGLLAGGEVQAAGLIRRQGDGDLRGAAPPVHAGRVAVDADLGVGAGGGDQEPVV